MRKPLARRVLGGRQHSRGRRSLRSIIAQVDGSGVATKRVKVSEVGKGRVLRILLSANGVPVRGKDRRHDVKSEEVRIGA